MIPYDLNSPLFSDYTDKFRFVKLPAGHSAEYRADEAFEFPVGTVIAKTFAYPIDARDPAQGRRLLETRILKREAARLGRIALHLERRADRGGARRGRRHGRRGLDRRRTASSAPTTTSFPTPTSARAATSRATTCCRSVPRRGT